jgi:3-oxoacyl-[acyl-carrier-protein] synthase II
MSRAATITGVGIVSSLGTGCQAHLDAMLSGRDGLREVNRFATTGLASTLAGTWPHWDDRKQKSDPASTAPSDDFSLFEIALVAAREALQSAKLHTKKIGLIMGTCFGKGFREFHSITEKLAAALEISGPLLTISTACASSTNAIGLARDWLYQNEVDAVLAGGADVLLQEVFAGFSSLGVLSPQKCAPFSEPQGTNLAEGAGFLVLERPQDALARQATSHGSIHGYGLSSDGYHETTPDPGGTGISRAIRGALQDAQWPREQIDFVSAHATGTTTNDRVEWGAIQRELSRDVKVCGSKSQVGHAQGAAGVVELILALLAMSQKKVPATLHFQGARVGCPADPMASNTPRAAEVSRALKLSSAFGGANASLAFSPLQANTVESPKTKKTSRVVIRGVGIAGPNTNAELFGKQTPKRDALPVDPRRLDLSSRLLVAATNACFVNSGAPLPKGAAREKAGIFVGAPHMPEESANKCSESMRQNGVARASATAFARMSVNSPTGTCARLFGLLGPSSTLSIGEGSGLAALSIAADWLASRQDADLLLVGSIDEPIQREPLLTEGAACILLTQEQEVTAGQIEIVSWGILRSQDAPKHIQKLLTQETMIFSDGPVEAPGAQVVDVSLHYTSTGSTRSMLAVAAAIHALQQNKTSDALVLNTRSATTCVVRLQIVRQS